jgi:hypothetical protein
MQDSLPGTKGKARIKQVIVISPEKQRIAIPEHKESKFFE